MEKPWFSELREMVSIVTREAAIRVLLTDLEYIDMVLAENSEKCLCSLCACAYIT